MGKYLTKHRYDNIIGWRDGINTGDDKNISFNKNILGINKLFYPELIEPSMKFIREIDNNHIQLLDIEKMIRSVPIHNCPNQEISAPGTIHDNQSISPKAIIQQCFFEKGIPYRGDNNTIVLYFTTESNFDPEQKMIICRNYIYESIDELFDFDYAKDYIKYIRRIDNNFDDIYAYLSNRNAFYLGKMYAISLYNGDIERCDGFDFKIQSIQDEIIAEERYREARVVEITRSRNIEVGFHPGALGGPIRVPDLENEYRLNDGTRISVFCKTDIGNIYFYSENNNLPYRQNGSEIDPFFVKLSIPNDGKFYTSLGKMFFSQKGGHYTTRVHIYNYDDAKNSGLFPNIESMVDTMETGKVYPIEN